jgi:hypothetical protein
VHSVGDLLCPGDRLYLQKRVRAELGIEDISRLVGHSGTHVTELVYRHELRPDPNRSDCHGESVLLTADVTS